MFSCSIMVCSTSFLTRRKQNRVRRMKLRCQKYPQVPLFSFVFICVFSSWMNKAQWTSYIAVGGKRCHSMNWLLLFPRRTGNKSTADSKHPDENSKLPEFQNEIARFFYHFCQKLLNFSPFLPNFLRKIVGINYIQLRHIIKATDFDIPHHIN